jgi:hypothetical protein
MSLKAKVLMPALLPVVITNPDHQRYFLFQVEPQSRAGHADNARSLDGAKQRNPEKLRTGCADSR